MADTRVCRLFVFLMTYLLLEDHSATVAQNLQTSLATHIYGGVPGPEKVVVRNGYAFSFDDQRGVPKWVAYKIVLDFLNIPPREGRYTGFKKDLDQTNPVLVSDYSLPKVRKGTKERSKFDRGHLAPFSVMGGDRNRNGKYALVDVEDPNHDEQDAVTLLQSNLMTNIAPQSPRCVNGSAGVWYKLERYVQQVLVKAMKQTVWVFAGTVFYPEQNIEKIGRRKYVHVPHAFFKVLILEDSIGSPRSVAFLFPHYPDIIDGKDCVESVPAFDDETHLVSISDIEKHTGLDFFSSLPDQVEKRLEYSDPVATWQSFFRDLSVVIENPHQSGSLDSISPELSATIEETTTLQSKTMDTEIEMLEQLKVIALLVIAAGVLGGMTSRVVNKPAANPKDALEKTSRKSKPIPHPNPLWAFIRGSQPWLESILLGVVAASMVPLFLELISSSVIGDIGSNDIEKRVKSLLVFFGFCTAAAITSKAFIHGMSRQVVKKLSDLEEKVKEQGKELADQQRQAEFDSIALEVVGRHLDLDAEPVDDDELKKAISRASLGARSQVSVEATRYRRLISEKNDAGELERVVPIFGALLEAPDGSNYHQNFANLGLTYMALPDAKWSLALSNLSKAIDIRPPIESGKYKHYEFYRGVCRIAIEETGEPQNLDATLDDLRAARRQRWYNYRINNHPLIKPWLKKHGMTLKKLE